MGPYILVVEDDRAIAELILDILTDEGYAVEVIDEGTAVLPAIQAHRPDLIILDIGLPKMSGNDVLITLRIMGFTDIPIIISTAQHNPERYSTLGPVAILPKPYAVERLLALVQQHTAERARTV